MGASSRIREKSRERVVVISAFVSSSFAKLRAEVLQRRKNTVLGQQLPLDVALRFAAPLVARLHASVYVEGKLSAFLVLNKLVTPQGNVFSLSPRTTHLSRRPATRRLGQVWPLCTHCTSAWCECSSIFSRSHATK